MPGGLNVRLHGYACWFLFFIFYFLFSPVRAQDVIVNPDISYAGTPRSCEIGGINVKGVEGYEDFVLIGLSGLSVGQVIDVPGTEITEAVKRYWKHGLFSKVAITADSLVGSKIYLCIHLATRPRVSAINYNGLKKSEREDMETKLGIMKGAQITPNMIDRAKILAKKYFDDKGFKNAEIEIVQRDDVTGKNEVILDVNIDKKSKMKVRHIILQGNEQLTDQKIKGSMPLARFTKPASFQTSSRPRNIPLSVTMKPSRRSSTSITNWATATQPFWKTPYGPSTRTTSTSLSRWKKVSATTCATSHGSVIPSSPATIWIMPSVCEKVTSITRNS